MKTDVSEFLEREILVMPKRTTNIQKFKKQMGTSFAVGRCSANIQIEHNTRTLRFFKYEFVCKICQQFHGTHPKILEGNTSANVLSHFALKATASKLQNSNV